MLHVQHALKSGDMADVSLNFARAIPRGESEIARTDDSALLMQCLPMPAMWENAARVADGCPTTRFAETSDAQPADIQMALTAPEKVTPRLAGLRVTAEQRNGDGTKTLTMQLLKARATSPVASCAREEACGGDERR